MYVAIWSCSTVLIWLFPGHDNGHRLIIVVVRTQNSQVVAAATTLAAQRWPHLLNEITETIVDPHLVRPETRATTRQVIRALLAPLTAKNCWTLVVDETGHIKKGTHPIGAARQSPQPLHGREAPRCDRPGRELPGRGLPRLHHRRRSHVDRPPPLSPCLLDR